MNRRSGFTLIALIVTLAIAAIVLNVGIPSFREMMRENRLATQTNEFLAALARVEEATCRPFVGNLLPLVPKWGDLGLRFA